MHGPPCGLPFTPAAGTGQMAIAAWSSRSAGRQPASSLRRWAGLLHAHRRMLLFEAATLLQAGGTATHVGSVLDGDVRATRVPLRSPAVAHHSSCTGVHPRPPLQVPAFGWFRYLTIVGLGLVALAYFGLLVLLFRCAPAFPVLLRCLHAGRRPAAAPAALRALPAPQPPLACPAQLSPRALLQPWRAAPGERGLQPAAAHRRGACGQPGVLHTG